MPNVLFDDEIFSIQFEGGICRYFTELMEGLAAVPDVKAQLPFRFTCNRHLAASRHFARSLFWGSEFWGGRSIPGRRTLIRAINRHATASALARHKPDVVHATLYDDTLLDRVPPATLVITVHDMVPELMPEAVGGIASARLRAKRSLIENAAGIGGFGMPILEAMINRCPVIIQKKSCFPEIAGDAALYFYLWFIRRWLARAAWA
jgi:hypothetical protein